MTAIFTAGLTGSLLLATPLGAQMFESFENAPENRWVYVADTVMGGVSQGQAELTTEDGDQGVRLTGSVSTANNGGFVQVRTRFDGLPDGATGLRMSVKGNGETYYVFLRTKGQRRVWHSYRQTFATGAEWAEVTLPLSDFEPSHVGMAQTFDPRDVTGLGIVAYGKDFEADVSVRWIEVVVP